MRASCLTGPLVVGHRWRWFPVALSGAAGPQRWGVRIVQIWCLRKGVPDAEGRPVVPPPVQPFQVVRAVGPHVCH